MHDTASPQRKITFRSRSSCMNSSTVSWSMNEMGRSCASTSVTCVPRRANIDAYSTPITPPPTTTSARGRVRSDTMSSLVKISDPSVVHPGGTRARVPVAMRTWSAVMRRSPERPSTSSVCASTKLAEPLISVTSLRRSWSRITRPSSDITCSTRRSSISIVGRTGSIPAISIACIAASPRTLITASRNVFEGIVPRCSDTPPTPRRRSMRPTRRPSFAACTAARWPDGPLPITRRSYS